MYKYLIVILFVSTSVFSQQKLDHATVDSLTYNFYLNGNWNELILLGKRAVNEGIDFKYLQQRLGYAYYAQQNYYAAIRHYQHALIFDADDAVSHTYLYYSALYINDEAMARYHFSKLDAENQAFLKIKKSKLVEAIDLEYNYKINKDYAVNNAMTSDLRSNPQYKRIGLNSQLGYRFNLYQSYSTFTQKSDYFNQAIQNEYYVAGVYSLFSRTSLMGAYHYVGTTFNTDTDSLKIPGNLWFGKLTHSFSRFDVSLSQSRFTNDYNDVSQTGLQLGFSLPLKPKIYWKSSVYNITESDSSRLVFNQTIGALIARRFWLQGTVTIGNLNNFVDNNALYLYNSLDHTTFRTGASLFYYLGKHITVFTNYSYDKKLIVDSQYNYKQHSFTGGLIWKF
ncbi:MAG: hypothetical protein AUK44_06005 [Porphyromonadaceae bacterium CG2_30_38_12]|nr:MAG: hypothetical protein AUK44_06005 [Porphyromonadaceae bacterium CG2_30_38_12]